MSDDEREYSEEELEVEEVEDKKSRSEVSDGGKMTETEMAIEEKLRKKKEEEEAMWSEYIEQRKKQRQKEEEELKKLKERQSKRKTQRAEQEKLMLEMKRKQEEQKTREYEEKKQREQEAKRKRLEEAEKKRQAMMQAMQKQKEEVKPNFVINKKSGEVTGGLPSTGGFGKSDLNKTKEQLAEEKKIAMAIRLKPIDIEGMDKDELRKKAQDLWEQIVQLESEKYDLEERQKRQDYDLKELNERQRQINRNKALKKGLDPEALSGKYPPKIQTASKYERRVDRRTYVDKKTLFEGGLIEAYKVTIEKTWEDKNNEYREKTGQNLPKWDPSNPKNKETYEPGARMIDDDPDDIDLMEQYKQKFSSIQEETPVKTSQPPPPSSRVEEEEEEEEYEEEEEEEDE